MIKILIVDDEPHLCEYLAEFFRERGHEAKCISKPNEVLPFVFKQKPDIVLLDVLMPEISGLEILKSIKSKHKDSVKVIMVTVADDAKTQQQAKAYGADDFIIKPFDTNYLENVVMTKISELAGFNE